MLTNESFVPMMEALGPFEPEPRIAVAVSGGGDSLALAYVLHEWAKKRRGKIIALTVDHGLRPEAKNEAQQVARWMKKAGIEHHILTYSGARPESNIQEHARNLRYDLLTQWCRANDILHLCTAHHRDDQCETFIMRLQRGSGVEGLACMYPESARQGVRLLRPLLNVPKQALTEYLKAAKHPWVHDPSNDNLDYTRNALRKSLAEIADSEELYSRIAATVATMQQAAESLSALTRQTLRESVQLFPEGYAMLDPAMLAKAPRDTGLRALSLLLTTIAGETKQPRLENLQLLYDALCNAPSAFKGQTLWGCKLAPGRGNKTVVVAREVSAIPEAALLSPEKEALWDRWKIKLSHKENDLIHYYIDIFSRNGALIKAALSESEWHRLKKLFPADALAALPVIVAKNSAQNLAKLVSIPHIDYYCNGTLKNQVGCVFSPPLPMTRN